MFLLWATRQVLMPCSSILVSIAVLSLLFFRYVGYSNMGIVILARQRVRLEPF